MNLEERINEEEQKENILKEGKLSEDNKKEGEKVLFPFKKKDSQKISSVIALIVGVLMMISPTTLPIGFYKINTFILGIILAFLGFIYLLDIQ